MIYLLYTIHVLVCLFLILVVLLQQGKGADLSVFGGGATQAAFGARGAVSLLHKLTVWGFVAFIVTTISIGFMTASRKASSVMSDVPVVEQATPAAAEEGEPATGQGELPATAVEEGTGAAAEGVEEEAEGSVDEVSSPAEPETGEAAGSEEDGG